MVGSGVSDKFTLIIVIDEVEKCVWCPDSAFQLSGDQEALHAIIGGDPMRKMMMLELAPHRFNVLRIDHIDNTVPKNPVIMHWTGEKGKDEIEDGEARCPRIARRPQTPTKAEVEAHMTLHAEYRDWCPHCVHGRGMSRQHRNKGSEKLGR